MQPFFLDSASLGWISLDDWGWMGGLLLIGNNVKIERYCRPYMSSLLQHPSSKYVLSPPPPMLHALVGPELSATAKVHNIVSGFASMCSSLGIVPV